VAETGFSILALSIQPPPNSFMVIFLSLIPRGLGLVVWALGLTVLANRAGSLKFSAVKGLARSHPLAALGIVLAHLSTAGFPLLAGFPPRLGLWEGLAGNSLSLTFWLLMGTLGLLTGAMRSLAVLVMAPEYAPWESNETWTQRVMLALGILGLFILGILPQTVRPLLENLPLMFSRLGQ
jgi:NADH:ubiquinone oxidoreductase subunit 2 (subunit N)